MGFSVDPITTKLANSILEYGEKIEDLDISGRFSAQGMEKVSQLKSLKKLTLRHSGDIQPIFTSVHLVLLANHCPALTLLNVSSFQRVNGFENNEDLKAAFKLFFEKKSLALKTLKLAYEYKNFFTPGLTPGCLEFLFYCQSLEELETSRLFLSKKDLLAISKLENLKHLELCDIQEDHWPTDLASEDYRLLLNLKKLEYLSLYCDDLLDKTSIQKLIKGGGFPKLEKMYLWLNRKLHLNRQILEKLMDVCPSLKELSLNWLKIILPYDYVKRIKKEKQIKIDNHLMYSLEKYNEQYPFSHEDIKTNVLQLIPDKIWIKIFSYIPISEIQKNLKFVSKCFQRLSKEISLLTTMKLNGIEVKEQSLAIQKIVQENNLLELEISHRPLCNKSFLCIDIKYLISLALQLNQKLKILKIPTHHCYQSSKSILKIINEYGNNIEHLDLDISIPKESLTLLSKMKKLKVFKFRYNSMSFNAQAIINLSECPNLEDVLISRFDYVGLSTEFSAWNINTQLSFDTFFKNKASTLKHFAFHPFGEYPNRCRFYSKAFRPGILKNIPLCQELETLSLKDGHVNEEDLKNITMLANLKVLVLHHIKTENLKPLFVSNNMINLVKIVISDTPANPDTLTALDMFHESGRFPKLEEIYLDQCRQMVLSDLSLEKLIQAFPKLNKISLCGIANALSDEYLFKLKNEGKLDIVLDDKKNHLVTKYGRYHSPSQLTISE